MFLLKCVYIAFSEYGKGRGVAGCIHYTYTCLHSITSAVNVLHCDYIVTTTVTDVKVPGAATNWIVIASHIRGTEYLLP